MVKSCLKCWHCQKNIEDDSYMCWKQSDCKYKAIQGIKETKEYKFSLGENK